MKYFLLSILFGIAIFSLKAQKKVIDSSVFDKWPTVQGPTISHDGKYVLYSIEKIPIDNSTLVIQSTSNNWKREFVGGSQASFSRDGKSVVFKSNQDSLCVWELGTDRRKYFPNVQAYQLVPLEKTELLALKLANEGKELVIYDLSANKKQLFSQVDDYTVGKDGQLLVSQIQEENNGKMKRVVQWISMKNGESRIIWNSGDKFERTPAAGNLAFDTKGDQVVFIVSELKNAKAEKTIWYYKKGIPSAIEKLSHKTSGFPDGCIITGCKFSQDGSCILFRVMKPTNTPTQKPAVMVDVWSHTDDKLQSLQLKELTEPIFYTALFRIDANKIITPEENQQLFENTIGLGSNALLATNPCYFEESNWRSSCRSSLFVVNICNGNKQLIKDGLISSDVSTISPNGEYVLYYSYENRAFFSYNISNGHTANITEQIPFPVFDKNDPRAGLPKTFSGLSNWLPGNNGVIIYDEYDIWQVDPSGAKQPVCLTNGYGRKNGVILRLAQENRLVEEQQILLVAFRPSDKANGFCRVKLGTSNSFEVLSMDTCLYYWPYVTGLIPVKAANADVWIVQRMTASNAPNYFITKDFKKFQRVSDVHPEKNYNWLSAELHEWTMFNGKKSQGILYKPENFDPQKKYPVIFHFYEKKSDELNLFLIPELTGHSINVPHFVSNGYLIFVPDIHYTIGEPAEGIFNAVVSAASYVAKLPFVDSTKMGLQGHSFGGYEVNVLITKTNLFAAAAEAAGATDLVSKYNSVLLSGVSNQFQDETGQDRIGATLWQRTDLFIKNSPIFYADKVTTPLLIMHCKGDRSVPFEQGLEWFTALRRLGKKVWMLQYDLGTHQLAGREAEDYTVRLMQFFDHYLKGKPSPKWMLQGVSARLKGIETGN